MARRRRDPASTTDPGELLTEPREGDGVPPIPDRVTPDEGAATDWERLFVELGSDVAVTVSRIGPPNIPETQKGILGELPPEAASSPARYLQERWGGGLYELTMRYLGGNRQRKRMGAVSRTLRLRIAGFPRAAPRYEEVDEVPGRETSHSHLEAILRQQTALLERLAHQPASAPQLDPNEVIRALAQQRAPAPSAGAQVDLGGVGALLQQLIGLAQRMGGAAPEDDSPDSLGVLQELLAGVVRSVVVPALAARQQPANGPTGPGSLTPPGDLPEPDPGSPGEAL